jgi:rare lipoprotein A
VPAASSSESTPLPAVPDDEPNLLAGEEAREFEQGKASWYGPRFNGRRTASGERYNMHELTAAHKTLPFGTLVRVRSLVNGKEVDVRITDRGPFSRGRVIDLSRAAAEAIGMLGLGVKDVLLLVPESTPAVAQAPPATVKRRPAPVRRTPVAR